MHSRMLSVFLYLSAEDHCDPCPYVFAGDDLKAASVAFYDPPGDSQSQTASSCLLGPGIICTVEAFKNMRYVTLAYSDAAVLYGKCRVPIRKKSFQHDLPAFRRILGGVFDQYSGCLLDKRYVAADRDRTAALKLLVVSFIYHRGFLPDLFHHFRKVEI